LQHQAIKSVATTDLDARAPIQHHIEHITSCTTLKQGFDIGHDWIARKPSVHQLVITTSTQEFLKENTVQGLGVQASIQTVSAFTPHETVRASRTHQLGNLDRLHRRAPIDRTGRSSGLASADRGQYHAPG
jgi:hypothetical protein